MKPSDTSTTDFLPGSDRTAGRKYGDACTWMLATPMPDWAREMPVLPTGPGLDATICFSGLPTDQAKEFEPALAKAGHVVVSNASAHRMWPDVPLLIPEVNADHTALIATQRAERGWTGAIVTNPNCTATGLTIALRPVQSATIDTYNDHRMAMSFALAGFKIPGLRVNNPSCVEKTNPDFFRDLAAL